ncbi:MAG: M23 family metallopeptidase [Candidatus Omnitrophica bacterium]|nr:M23 family metallopeptidase [Candidatus Omnitrophota bacterium]
MKPRPFLVGLTCGTALGSALLWLCYVDWYPVFAPLAQEPLVIRADAKGDGRFGAPRSGNRRHQGVDIQAPLGSPVRAIRSGRVMAVGRHRGLGRYLQVEHAGGLRSLYAHLDEMQVDVGARVRQGQAIGTVGKTGNARHPWIAPHLHLEVTRDGSVIDPQTLGLALVGPTERVSDADASGGE